MRGVPLAALHWEPRDVAVQGAAAAYREAGAGPVIVLLHGLGLSSAVWTIQSAVLAAAGLRVIAPDLPGFGHTPRPRRQPTIAETAQWGLALLDALGIARATWLGHSIAAQLAVELAAVAPTRSRAVVLASPTGAEAGRRRLRQLTGLLRDVPRERGRVFATVLREYVRRSPAVIAAAWSRAARHATLTRCSAVRCPALLVAGDRDPVVRPAALARFAAALSDADIVTIEGAAHGMVFSHAEQFSREVAAWTLTRGP
ncbi:MAG: alpha/beta fold hydrolase [Longimicrobiales bacterium]